MSEPTFNKISVTLRSLEIRAKRIFNNSIKQNQKLGSDSVLNQSTTVFSIQSPASSVQSPASRVQRPIVASRVQEFRYVKVIQLFLNEKLSMEVDIPQNWYPRQCLNHHKINQILHYFSQGYPKNCNFLKIINN